MLARAYVDKNIVTERIRKRQREAHQKQLSQIRSKDGVYKLGKIQSTEHKSNFNLSMHSQRRKFEQSKDK